MKISNLTLHVLFILFSLLGSSLVLSAKAQFNPACNDSDYLMQIRCRELQELDRRNEWNRQIGFINAQARKEEQQKKLIIAGVAIGSVATGIGIFLFKFIKKKSRQ
ncbi:MAG: hypothetical protein ACRC2R_09210 [Xenococcaceae cyanobacterium]